MCIASARRGGRVAGAFLPLDISASSRRPPHGFADSPEHAEFRSEVRSWLEANLPSEICVDDAADQRVSPDRETLEKRIAWQKTIHAAGWVGLSWSKEYGGRCASFMQLVIFDEEYTCARAPILPGASGLNLLVPSLIHWDTDEQSSATWPTSSAPDELWCQGFSEPDAGGDLTSLRTRAVDHGDHFVVNGQKVWTSSAHCADWYFPPVRTDPDAASTTASAICSSTRRRRGSRCGRSSC